MKAGSRYLPAFTIVACAMLGGCATVTRGTTNEVQIESEPTGVQVETSLNHKCTTPCTIKVGRKEEFSVFFRHPGYQDQKVDVKVQVAGAGAAGLAGNVLIGGVVGIGVDVVSGATLEHNPNPVKAILVKISVSPKAEPKNKKKQAPNAVPAPATVSAPAAAPVPEPALAPATTPDAGSYRGGRPDRVP